MFQQRPTEIVWVLIAAMVLAPCAACQQQPGTGKPGTGNGGEGVGDAGPQQLAYLTDTVAAAAIAHPARVLTDPQLEMLPIEVISAAGKKELGIDPVDVEQVLLMAEPPGPAGPPQVGVVIRFTKPYAMDEVLPMLREDTVEGELDGKPYHRAASPMALSTFAPDDRTLLVASDDLLHRMIAGKAQPAEGLTAKLLAEAADHDLAAVLAVEPIRELVKGQLSMAPVPPPFEGVRKVPDLLEAVEAKVNLTGGMEMALVLHAPDEAAADELATTLAGLLDTAGEMFQAQIATEAASDDPVEQAMAQYATRVNKKLVEGLKPAQEGDRLIFATEGQDQAQIATIGILIALLLPAVQAAREAARRAASTNHMKQIILGMHIHHDARKRLPARANFDEDGRPLLSWRVHILPFIEEQALYDQFNLDEPWDSPHNRELIAKMPEVYRNPSSPAEPGMSDYLAVTGEGTMFEGTEGRRIADVTDGTSNTIMVVEVNPEEAVIWTKPDDWQLDPERPLAGLGNAHPGGFVAGFGDGSVRTIPADVDANVFKALCTIAGGEVVSPDF